jgi:hypothetical protein
MKLPRLGCVRTDDASNPQRAAIWSIPGKIFSNGQDPVVRFGKLTKRIKTIAAGEL